MDVDDEKIMLMWDKYNNCYREVVDIKDIKGGIQMRPKKYEEVKKIENMDFKKIELGIKIETGLLILVLILIIALSTIYINLGIKYETLKIENAELVKVSEMKDSIIRDLEENCKDLFIQVEELKYGN